MFPEVIDFCLHAADVGGGDDHGVLVRNHDYVLAVGSVCTECIVTASPHLLAVSVQPVAFLYVLEHLRKHVGILSCRNTWNLS